MNFSEKIEALRSKAQETQAANKIIDMLKDIESKNNNTTSYRWIWELIQNAKDVANSSETVDILIEFDEKDKFIKFKHNGKLFSTKNIIFLIEQVSTKDRGKVDSNVKKTTGKFGTGFLTTHLLSKNVNVSGYLQDDEDKPYSFNIDIDRSSDEQAAIIRSIEDSCNQLDKNSVEAIYSINEKDYNTCFTYLLDHIGIDIAKKGLNNLIVSSPYVFTFVPEINSIEISANLIIGQYQRTIKRVKTINSSRLANAKVICIDVNTNGKSEQRYIFTLADSDGLDLALAVEIGLNGNEKFIKQVNTELPKLFCDFPLLGTNDFSFPVVINSASFNPTEPRDGVYLTHDEHDIDEVNGRTENKDIKENKAIMIKAVKLYNILLNHFLSDNYKGIYNITKISEPPIKEWLSEVWVSNNITDKLKSNINEIKLIDTHYGTRTALRDEWDEPCILIPNHSDSTIRNTLWSLSSSLIPDMITRQDELECWYNSLWEACKNYSVDDLIKRVENFKNLKALSENISGEVTNWLTQFYDLIYSKEYGFAKKLNTEPQIIPNQKGDFCTVSSLCIDCGIEEKYKDVALILGIDIKSKLIDNAFKVISNRIFMNKYKFEDMVTEILRILKLAPINLESFYKDILCLKCKELEKQNKFLDLLKAIYREDSWVTYKVSNFSDELFDLALNFWVEKVCIDMSKCGSLLVFTDTYSFEDTSNCIEWLVRFTDYISKFEMQSIFDRFPLLPNQNGDFKKVSELNLDSGEIDDVIKEVCKITGYDIKETLLLKDIYYKMPKSRTITNEHISGRITDYIEAHKNNLGITVEEKTTFRNFYLYLSENRLAKHIETAFSKLCANLNWLYNDEDIAENMRIVEEYNDILSRYGVSGVSQLESILSTLNSKAETFEKIEISKELLAQWGITTEEELLKALSKNVFGSAQIHRSTHSAELFDYVKTILDRAKNNIINYLYSHDDYKFDKENIHFIGNTIFRVSKLGYDIYIIARPSDFEQVILYYDTEIDLLDFDKDCELWVENGVDPIPKKITLGKIMKLTGVNKIPLRSLQNDNR